MLAGEVRGDTEEKYWPALTLAATAYRAAAHASSGAVLLPWEQLDEEDQEPWLRLGGSALDLLTRMDGCKLSAILPEAWKKFGQGLPWEEIADRIPFEAAVRHIYQVLDSEGEPNLEGMEVAWAAWAERKREENLSYLKENR